MVDGLNKIQKVNDVHHLKHIRRPIEHLNEKLQEQYIISLGKSPQMDKLNGEIPKIDKRICILEQLGKGCFIPPPSQISNV